MRILVLAHRLPFPPDDGSKVRTFHVVRALAAVADVTLVVLHREADPQLTAASEAMGAELIAVRAPRSYTPHRLLLGLITSTPVHAWNQRSRTYGREVRRVLSSRQIDVALSESTLMYRYFSALPAEVPRIVDMHNIDSVTLGRYAQTIEAPLRRRYSGVTAGKLRRLEKRTLAEADLVWVCSDAEATLARSLAPGADVWTVPNGVDTEALSPAQAAPEPRRLLFFGRLDYYPNIDALSWFAADILPLLRDVELDVVGQAATSDLQALARREPAIRLLGRVEEIRLALAPASVVVVPLRVGGGTRLKIVESLAMAKPTVSTTIGAEGLDLVPGEDLLVADTPSEFAAAVQALLDDPRLAARLGAHGRETVRRRYDWREVSRAIEDSLSNLGLRM